VQPQDGRVRCAASVDANIYAGPSNDARHPHAKEQRKLNQMLNDLAEQAEGTLDQNAAVGYAVAAGKNVQDC